MPDSDTQHPQFSDFGLHPEVLNALSKQGYVHPTPIQAQAIPVILQKRDVMGLAQTGTGKTAAFTLPMLQLLLPFGNSSASPARHPVRALILAPTRELADQVAESVRNYGNFTLLRSAVVFGGVDITVQREQLRQGIEILIATPGRLLDHVQQKNINLGQVQLLVLDEADRMLDMGFLPDITRIINLLPKQRQSLLFSATFSNEIRKLAQSLLNTPVTIEVAQRNATADTVEQKIYILGSLELKRSAVSWLIRTLKLKQVLVFSNSKLGAARLARELEKGGIHAGAIHGDKSQLERIKVLEAFKAGELTALVATDVAARGIDIAELPCVINYDLPYNAEDYVHRIGRTGRAGSKGTAISLYTPEDEKLLHAIEHMIKRDLPREALSETMLSPRNRKHSAINTVEKSGSSEKHTDPWFFKPYEPSGLSSKSVSEKKPPSSPTKRATAALLGGLKKKDSKEED